MKSFITLFFSLNFCFGFSQQVDNYNDSLITITGKVIDTTKTISFFNVMAINKTVGRGIFGNYDGTFSITVKKSDKIAISVAGYRTQYFTFTDKAFQKEYYLKVYLDLISVTSKPVEVRPLKTLDELQKERANIVRRELPKVTAIDAISSPITALYVAFSKREKTKRKIAELEFKDQQAAVVKEILRIYVNADIIELESSDFEAFISFLNLNDSFLRTASDYELIIYIKYKFEHFIRINKDGF